MAIEKGLYPVIPKPFSHGGSDTWLQVPLCPRGLEPHPAPEYSSYPYSYPIFLPLFPGSDRYRPDS